MCDHYDRYFPEERNLKFFDKKLGQISDEEIKASLRQALEKSDLEKRIEALEEAVKILSDELRNVAKKSSHLIKVEGR
jgi:ferritin-like metal-binding protein YciE